MENPNFKNHTLIPVVSHIEPQKRTNGLAPTTYACIWLKPDGSAEYFTGYGWEKSSSVMLARCISLALEEVLEHDPDVVRIDCIREEPGFGEKQDENVLKQLSAGTVTVDGHGAYRRMTELRVLANLVERKPTTAQEGELINHSKELANANKPDALSDFLANIAPYARPCIRAQKHGLLPIVP